MKKTFTRAEILQGSGCYRNEKGKAESIIGDKQEMTIQEILDLEISFKDKFWFVRNNCELTDEELRMLDTADVDAFDAAFTGASADAFTGASADAGGVYKQQLLEYLKDFIK